MIEYLKYRGEKLPIRANYYAEKHTEIETGKTFQQAQRGDSTDYAVVEAFLFYSLKAGHKIVGKEFKFKMEDMEDILDESRFEFFSLIPKFYPSGVNKKTTPAKKKP